MLFEEANMVIIKIFTIILAIYNFLRTLLGCGYHFGILECESPEPFPIKNFIISVVLIIIFFIYQFLSNI